MIDLTKLTTGEANTIECALLQLHSKVKSTIECYDELSKDESLSAKARETMASNRDWWEKAYDLIYNTKRR